MSIYFQVQKRYLELQHSNVGVANVLYVYRDIQTYEVGIRSICSNVSELDSTKEMIESQDDFFSWDITMTRKELTQNGFCVLVRDVGTDDYTYVEVWINGKFSGVKFNRNIKEVYLLHGYDSFVDIILKIYKDDRISSFIKFDVFRQHVFSWFGFEVKIHRYVDDDIKNLNGYINGDILNNLNTNGIELDSYEVWLGADTPKIIAKLYGQPTKLDNWIEGNIPKVETMLDVNVNVKMIVPQNYLDNEYEDIVRRYINYIFTEAEVQDKNLDLEAVSCKLLSSKLI